MAQDMSNDMSWAFIVRRTRSSYPYTLHVRHTLRLRQARRLVPFVVRCTRCRRLRTVVTWRRHLSPLSAVN